MRIFIITLLFNISVKAQNVLIHGHVTNYYSKTIPFFKKDYTTFTDVHIKEKKYSNGYYEFQFNNSKPQLFKLFLEWVFIEPGDSVEFDFSFVDISSQNFYDSIHVEGKYPGNYLFYKTTKKWYENEPIFKTNFLKPAESYYKSLKKFYFKALPALIKKFKKIHPISKKFNDFINLELRIKFLSVLFQEYKKNNINISEKLSKKIQRQIKLCNLDDEKLLTSPNYVFFGFSYIDYFLPFIHKTKNSFDIFLTLKKYFENRFVGKVKDFWMSLLIRVHYFNKPSIFIAKEDSLKNIILSSLEDSNIRKALEKFIFSRVNRNEDAVKEVKVIGLDNKVHSIKELFRVDSGHVCIIDFWASWCVPCIKASEKLNEIIGNLGEVKVIKISVDENESDWRQSIKKHNYPKKEQYLIQNSEEYKKISSLIDLESIPRFLITTRSGTIIYYQAFSPFNTKEFIEQVEYASRMK